MKIFSYSSEANFVENNDNFQLHFHETFEIFHFHCGDTEYIVEGTVYPLSPNDVIILRQDEMHRAFHKSPSFYSRASLNVGTGFFSEMNCEDYKKAFLNRKSGQGNKIPASVARESGLLDALARLEKYKEENPAIQKAVIVEILHIINSVTPQTPATTKNTPVKEIILYLNRNLTSNISLESLAEHFFISKYHMCRIFKQATGHTIGNYINYKRLQLVKEMCEQGQTLATACLDSGFGSYSSFYKAYVKAFGVPPKNIKSHLE